MTQTFDEANRVLAASSNDGLSSMSWRTDGRLESINHSNGVESFWQYDSAKRLTQIAYSKNSVATLTLQYNYDSNGNRIGETRTEAALPGQSARSRQTIYNYDHDDRLVQALESQSPPDAANPDTYTTWALDGVGNRLSETVTRWSDNVVLSQKTFTYNERDQLTRVVDPVNQLEVRYQYDGYGNRTRRELWRGLPLVLVNATTYTFDARDRLIKAEPDVPNSQNAPTLQFVYDAEDQKVARIETPWLNGQPQPASASVTYELREGLNLLHEAIPGSAATQTPNADGLKITDSYRYGAKLDRHIRFAPSGNGGGSNNPQANIHFYQLDALNTPVVISDSQGDPVVSNTLDAWGNTEKQTANGQSSAPGSSADANSNPRLSGQANLVSNDQQSIGYTGYQKDQDLGLYYANARWYDPILGQFNSSDPANGDVNRPITFNKYLYGNGSPVVFVDPDGRRGRDSFGADLALIRGQMNRSEDIARADAMIQRNIQEKAGRADAIQEFAVETAASLLELGSEVHSAQIKYQTFGLVDTGGDAKLEDRSYAVYRFLANNPIDAIGDNLGRRMAAADAALAAGDYRAAARISMGVGLDVASGATGAASLIRSGGVGIARLTGSAGREVSSMAGSIRRVGAVDNEMMPPLMARRGDFPEIEGSSIAPLTSQSSPRAFKIRVSVEGEAQPAASTKREALPGSQGPSEAASTRLAELRTHYLSSDPCDVYCTDYAEQLMQANGGSGEIVVMGPRNMDWPSNYDSVMGQGNREALMLPNSIDDSGFAYHSVYSDGVYIYDPFVSKAPFSKKDYVRSMRSANPSGISHRLLDPSDKTKRLRKGPM
ncbi:hypothetical protein C7S18_16835 [Ahniella affigens]|uniref:Uncharacterized protein n=1 Tax=Ahniella affigens TaxID=2021234 RepID=A0A2P1PV73_9GAMM|nr:RHS repeat-associated core domain-containing protein [Ahniella affigens]AVP98751.1 hypothetical protein C7S18_16835 [Ahniella affigens]